MAYSKLHSTIVNSSLWEAPDATRLLFITLLAMCDRDGVVYGSRGGLARIANIAPDDVDDAWSALMSPDPDSGDRRRAPENEGRRIEEVPGGFRLLNFDYYRGLRNDDDRREQNRAAQAKHKAKISQGKPRSAAESLDQPPKAHTEAEAEAEAEKGKPAIAGSRSSSDETAEPTQSLKLVKSPPDCPHGEVLALWAEVLPSLPQHNADLWRGTRADHLRARWRETATLKGWSSKADGLAYFRDLFGYVGRSQFLTGKVKPREGSRPFSAELEWLVNPSNWAKLHEGKYHQSAA